MNKLSAGNDVWLVYDGECPVCATYCKYIRIREAAGQLHLVDARHPGPLLDQITALGLDIDQGMVLKLKGVIYYGAEAIHMLTLLSTPSGIFNRINYYVFSTSIGARIFYPLGKAARNVLLKLLGIRYIDNLKHASHIETDADKRLKNQNDKVIRSQSYFNKLSLFFYDFILYGLISKYAWGCTISRLDQQYRRYATSNHLDVGVGTGFLLNRVVFDSPRPRLALMDLSQECLTKTAGIVERYQPETYVQNLLEPIHHRLAPFDSIGINYVMHCVPGSFAEKGIAFIHLRDLLSDTGVLFGTSVLAKDVPKNALAKVALWLLNALGVFNNRDDKASDLKAFLDQHFDLIAFEVVRMVAFFAVKKHATQ